MEPSASPQVARINEKHCTKLEKVPEPNKKEYLDCLAQTRKEINKSVKRLKDIGAIINATQSKRSEFIKKKTSLFNDIKEANNELKDLEMQRTPLAEKIADALKAKRDTKMKLLALQKDLGFQSTSQIDQKIREIQELIMSKNIPVSEENKLISKIQKLEKSKPLLLQYAQEENDNFNSDDATGAMKKQLEDLKQKVKAAQIKRKELYELIPEDRDAAALKELFQERDELREKLSKLREEEESVWNEMHQKLEEYNRYMETLRKVTAEKREEERKKRELQYEIKDLEKELECLEEGQEWSLEYKLTMQTIAYLRSLIAKAGKSREPIPESVKQMDMELPIEKIQANLQEDGVIVMTPKNLRDDEFTIKPKKKKVEKKSKRNGARNNYPLVHDFSSLANFKKLNVVAPLFLSDCPTKLKVLEEKLEKYREKHSISVESANQKRIEILDRIDELRKLCAES